MSNGINFNNINPYEDGQYTFANKNFYSNDVEDFEPLFLENKDLKNYQETILATEVEELEAKIKNPHYTNINEHNIVISSALDSNYETIFKNTELIDSEGTIVGNAQISYDYNKYGNVVNRKSIIYDSDGNKIGTSNYTYIYDGSGNVIGINSITSQKNDDGTIIDTEKKLDKFGRVEEESITEHDTDGSTKTETSKYTYAKSDYQENFIESMNRKAEEVARKILGTAKNINIPERFNNMYSSVSKEYTATDKNGNIVYELSRTEETKGTVKILQEMYPYCYELDLFLAGRTGGEYIKDACDILERNGYDTSIDAINSFINKNVEKGEFTINSLSKEKMKTLKDDLNAKLDAMYIDNGWFGDCVKNSYKSKIEKAYETEDAAKLQNLYNKIYSEMYPDGAYTNIATEIIGMENADKNFKEEYLHYSYGSDLSEQEKMNKYLSENFVIRESFDPQKDIPENYGEILLIEMEQLKDEYNMYKEQMGSFDKLISLCDYFGIAGTGEKEIQQLFTEYEKAIKGITKNPIGANEFTNKFKALTGDFFTAEKLENLALTSVIFANVDKMDNQALLNEAKNLGIDTGDVSTTHNGISIATKINYNHIKTQIKEIYRTGINNRSVDENSIVDKNNDGKIDSISAQNIEKDEKKNFTIIDKKTEDYKDSVINHRDFVIDLTRTALVAATQGQSVYISGAIGLCVETLGIAFNADAQGEQKITVEEALSKMISGTLSSISQGASKNILRGLGFTTKAELAKELSSQIEMKNTLVINNTIYKLLDNVGIKGVGSGVVKNISEFILKDPELSIKVMTGNATNEEKDIWITEFDNEIKAGTINGVATGTILTLFSLINTENAKNLITKYKEKTGKPLSIEGATETKLLNAIEYLGSDILQSTGKAGSRILSDVLQGNEIDFNDFTEKELKEIAKQVLKPS